MYVHGPIVQGHTHRGQLLGSVAANGGGGGELAVDVYRPGGRYGVALTRVLRQQEPGEGARPQGYDVVNGLRGEAVLFRSRMDVTAGLGAEYELNRDFQRDVFNLAATLGVRWRFSGDRGGR
jgi:hypothetical protein